MNGADLTTGITGKTIRFIWKDGPTAGKTHEHVFHEDGTVEWREAGVAASPRKGAGAAGRPKFLDDAVANGVRLVSYLADSGFTLTVTLNQHSGLIAGVASNDKTWVPVHGQFEVVEDRGRPAKAQR